MHRRGRGTFNLLWIPVVVLMLTLNACGSAAAEATPTLSVDAIFTAAYETFSAQAATQLALTPPTDTPSPTLQPTLPPTLALPTFSLSTATLSTGGQSACDKSAYVSDVTIPDNTIITAGQSFVKTWMLQNTGTCTWSTSYKLTFGSGDVMGGAAAAITVPVPPGNQSKVSVNLVAPTANGTYTGRWRMQNANGLGFGDVITVVIKVGTGGTVTAGPSPTSGPTSATGYVTISGNAGATSTNINYTGGTEFTTSGNTYSFTVPVGWSGTVTPSKGAYVFSPSSMSFTNVTSDLSGQNFSASLPGTPTATSTP